MTAFLSFIRTTRFASFPDHLVIQIKKFTFGLDWVPKKLGEQRYGYIFVLKTCFGFFFLVFFFFINFCVQKCTPEGFTMNQVCCIQAVFELIGLTKHKTQVRD